MTGTTVCVCRRNTEEGPPMAAESDLRRASLTAVVSLLWRPNFRPECLRRAPDRKRAWIPAGESHHDRRSRSIRQPYRGISRRRRFDGTCRAFPPARARSRSRSCAGRGSSGRSRYHRRRRAGIVRQHVRLRHGDTLSTSGRVQPNDLIAISQIKEGCGGSEFRKRVAATPTCRSTLTCEETERWQARG